jgi:hypothetical protein
MDTMNPPNKDNNTIKVRFGLSFFIAGSAMSRIFINSFSFASSILAISYC